jgi:hypothetical protein
MGICTFFVQVFLLDSQKFVENVEEHPDLLSRSDRSVMLLLSNVKKPAQNGENKVGHNEEDIFRFVVNE